MTSINSYKYMFNYLDSNKLNELLFRFDNKDIASDIQTLIDNDTILSKEHITFDSEIFITNKDIYGIIIFNKNGKQIGHFTIHFLPSKSQTQYIGPIHYKNNSRTNLGTRINISPSYNNNISKPIKLNFVNSANRNMTYKSPNRLITRIADKVKQLLDQRTFQTGSFTDLNLLNTKIQPCHPARFAVEDKGVLGIIQLSFIST